MIIDAHVHLPVVPEAPTYQESKALLLGDLQADGVDCAVLIPDNVPDSPIGDVPTCLRLVEDCPKLFLLGTIDTRSQGQAWVEELGRLIAGRYIFGMKIFPGHDPIYPTDPGLEPICELCQSSGVPLVIHTGGNSGHPELARYNDPKYIVQVAERYPALKIVIAHLFWPEVDYCYDLTHAYPTIYYDTSALADEGVVAATGKARIQSVLLRVVQEDPTKVLFGTDYAGCNRRDHLDMIDRLPISAETRDRMLWKNAVDLFGLPIMEANE